MKQSNFYMNCFCSSDNKNIINDILLLYLLGIYLKLISIKKYHINILIEKLFYNVS